MTIEKTIHLKMYILLKIGGFSNVMLVFRGVYYPIVEGIHNEPAISIRSWTMQDFMEWHEGFVADAQMTVLFDKWSYIKQLWVSARSQQIHKQKQFLKPTDWGGRPGICSKNLQDQNIEPTNQMTMSWTKQKTTRISARIVRSAWIKFQSQFGMNLEKNSLEH